jgi:hypothetical protein
MCPNEDSISKSPSSDPIASFAPEATRRPRHCAGPAQDIARAASKQLTEDGFTEFAARRALERIAAGPDGALAVQATETLRDYLHRAVERIAELKACIDDDRKFLRTSKARWATLARFVTRNEHDRTLSAARRAELLTLIQAASEELRYSTAMARANIDDARAEIQRIRRVQRDLLGAFLLGEELRYPGQRVPSFKDVGLAIEGFAASRLLPKTNLCKLHSLAKAEAARPGGAVLWPHTAKNMQNFFR